MKNIMITYLKVGGLTILPSMVAMLFFLLLFNDVLHEPWILVIGSIFLGAFMVSLNYFLMYTPIYYLNKSLFEKETIKQLYDRFLPIVMIPLTSIALLLFLSEPGDHMLKELYLLIFLGYMATFFSFYQFLKFIEN